VGGEGGQYFSLQRRPRERERQGGVDEAKRWLTRNEVLYLCTPHATGTVGWIDLTSAAHRAGQPHRLGARCRAGEAPVGAVDLVTLTEEAELVS